MAQSTLLPQQPKPLPGKAESPLRWPVEILARQTFPTAGKHLGGLRGKSHQDSNHSGRGRASCGFSAALLRSPHQMVLRRGTGNKAAERRESSACCRAGPWEANEPATNSPPRAGPTGELAAPCNPRKELAGLPLPVSYRPLLRTLLHVFIRNHRAITQPPGTLSPSAFSVCGKFHEAANSHRRVTRTSMKQTVHGASQITRCDGYVQSAKMLLHSLEKPPTVYHETELGVLTLH